MNFRPCLGGLAKMDRVDADLLGCLAVDLHVVDEDAGLGRQVDPLERQVVDPGVGFAAADEGGTSGTQGEGQGSADSQRRRRRRRPRKDRGERPAN